MEDAVVVAAAVETGVTAALSAAGCLAGAFISFKSLVNIIYSANGAVGIVLLLFMIAGSPLRTRRKP